MSAPGGDGPEVSFPQVERDATLSEKVARSITESILDGTLAPGHRLLSERELGEQFGVSRTVIREAVRSLVASGLVETHTGRSLRVAEVGPQGVSRAMAMLLHRSDAIDYRRVHEVRAALEIDMAGYAALRARPEDVKRLQDVNLALVEEGTQDAAQAAEIDVAFHDAIAVATGNALFPVLLGSIGPVLLDTRVRAFASRSRRRAAADEHAGILDAIVAGDADGARKAMRDHLEQGERHWQAEETMPALPRPR